MEKLFDVAVIGAGPGGYVAAIRCAQLGLDTICIDDWQTPDGKPSLGGVCLNVGCIPSKALLESSEHYAYAVERLAEHGVVVGEVALDLAAMQARKARVVHALAGGIGHLFRQHGVTSLHGRARFSTGNGHHCLEVSSGGVVDGVAAVHVIVATGSRPASLPGVTVDGGRIVDSTGALSFSAVPQRLGIIGAGVVGLELGSIWRRLGAQVTLLDAGKAFLPGVDTQVAHEALRQFKTQGLDIHLGAAVDTVKTGKTHVNVAWREKNAAQAQVFDKVLIAAGRRPRSANLGAEKVGLNLDADGFVAVDAQGRANVPGIFAIGDVARGPMLAHKAAEEGVAVAERIAGQAGGVDYALIPGIIYTAPEIAWVGKTEQQLKAAHADYRKGVFPFSANGRARAQGESAGFAKLLADAKTDRLLGVHLIGPAASELIAEAVTAMALGASSEDMARTVHAHPTLAEALREAALAVDGRADAASLVAAVARIVAQYAPSRRPHHPTPAARSRIPLRQGKIRAATGGRLEVIDERYRPFGGASGGYARSAAGAVKRFTLAADRRVFWKAEKRETSIQARNVRFFDQAIRSIRNFRIRRLQSPPVQTDRRQPHPMRLK